MRTLIRSSIAGGAATAVDLIVLFVCIHVLGWSPRVASVPALLAGGFVNFHGNRHFAFRATAGRVERQAALFILSELVTLTLNGILYDLAVRTLHPGTGAAMAIRLVTQNMVFLAWSFPIWRLVFRRA
jgi:putative flippase GtrA